MLEGHVKVYSMPTIGSTIGQITWYIHWNIIHKVNIKELEILFFEELVFQVNTVI